MAAPENHRLLYLSHLCPMTLSTVTYVAYACPRQQITKALEHIVLLLLDL